MGKTLKDLTKEEIGRLFPIEISPYSNNWPVLFEKEKSLIIETIDPDLFSRIEHFGSTSVPGLSAKNTIDILMELEFDEEKNQRLIQQLATLGYEFNWQNEGGNTHMVFVKGYNVLNPKTQTYHIHAGPKTHPVWDRLLFKDYLIKHPETAVAYEKLKLKLSAEFKSERVAYRIAKTEFVNDITGKAKLVL
ncbi:GrpB family protein [Mucilaginibacter glaciei]|uniref:GrpB family protein n=1 Tax=Mucilaginibacter glaciei TaxID=2772109 RepID=A0A926NXE4_9SPHI|nr:GrpB family protein [Mucilaginibacter glaciei]MBD1393454.1 GrpB family protein [Mucilaginibacter glaciei]